MKTSRIPLAIALSAAIAFAAGCADRDNRAVDDRADAATAEDRADQRAMPPVGPVAADADVQADRAHVEADADRMGDGSRSDQPVNDTWITTKVKSSLLADNDVSGLDIEVETVNGVVTLSGQVEQQSQIDEAARIARDIEGVTRVETSALTIDANR
jgi:hyperosmotically inducible periplasmic protein